MLAYAPPPRGEGPEKARTNADRQEADPQPASHHRGSPEGHPQDGRGRPVLRRRPEAVLRRRARAQGVRGGAARRASEPLRGRRLPRRSRPGDGPRASRAIRAVAQVEDTMETETKPETGREIRFPF